MVMDLNTIHCGDALEWLGGLPGGSAEMCLTDIPYNVVSRKSSGLRKLDKGDADSGKVDIPRLVEELVRVVHGSMYVFCGTEQVSVIRSEFVGRGLTTRLCIWEKTNPDPMNGMHLWLSSIECCVFARKPKATFTRFCASPVWRHPIARPTGHPTPKPERLFAELVRASSKEGDVVIDPFCGSGTTAMVCEQLGRRWACCELNPEYVAMAERRIAKASGNPIEIDDEEAARELPMFART